MIPVYFRVYVDFECSNNRVVSPSDQKEKSKKIHIIGHQKLLIPGYYTQSELLKVLQRGYHEQFGEDSASWFVDEMIKTENNMNFYFDKTNIPLDMTKKD